jgi:hypothetical protein
LSARLFDTPYTERCVQTLRLLAGEGCKIHIKGLQALDMSSNGVRPFFTPRRF